MEPEIHGERGPFPSGLITGGVSSSNEVTSTLHYTVPTERDARDYRRGELHPELNIPEDSRTWTELDGCLGFDLSILYKGRVADEDGGDEFDLDASFAEEPLESHPNFLEIKKKYKGWVDAEGEIQFPETIKLEDKGGLKKGEGKEVKNPMFGVKTYLVLSAVVRHTYISTKRPRLSAIGKIVKTVPGGYQTPEDHDWLMMPPRSRRRGKGRYENIIEYQLSPLGGWPEGVYSLMEGKWQPDTEQGGLEPNNDPFEGTGWNTDQWDYFD